MKQAVESQQQQLPGGSPPTLPTLSCNDCRKREKPGEDASCSPWSALAVEKALAPEPQAQLLHSSATKRCHHLVRLQLGLCRLGPPLQPRHAPRRLVLASSPLCDRLAQPVHLAHRVARMQAHSHSLLAVRDRRVRDRAGEEAARAQEGGERARGRGEERDDGRGGRVRGGSGGRRRGDDGEEVGRKGDGGGGREDGRELRDEAEGECVDVRGGLRGRRVVQSVELASERRRTVRKGERGGRTASL